MSVKTKSYLIEQDVCDKKFLFNSKKEYEDNLKMMIALKSDDIEVQYEELLEEYISFCEQNGE